MFFKTWRTQDSNTDAYKVFRKMLERGYPQDDWDELVKEAKAETTRLQQIAEIDN
jgi:toxin YhaV